MSTYNKLNFEEFTLPNKLHCVLYKNSSNPLVNVTLGYKVGAKDEASSQYGAAHLFEHLMFEGSANVGKNLHAKIVMDCGGRPNAFTMQDATVYFEDLPSNHLETALWLESDRMNGINLSEENVANQKNVVLEEKKQRYDNAPYGTFLEKIMGNIFKGTLYEHTTIGREEDIKNFSVTDAVDFHTKFYSPANAELVVCGDIDYDNTRKLIEKYFGDINKEKEIIRLPNSAPELESDINVTVEDNVVLEKFYIAYKIPKAGTKEEYVLDYFTKLFFNNKSSAIYKKLVYEKQLLKSIGAYKLSLLDSGVYIILGTLNPGKSREEAEQIIFDEMQSFINNEVSDYQIEKIRNELEFTNVSKLMSLNLIAKATVFNRIYFNDANRLNNELSEYNSVTKEDLKNTVGKYFVNAKKLRLNYIPKKT